MFTTDSHQSQSGYGSNSLDDDALFRRVTWRIIPLLFLSYLINYLDRTNVAYAQLQMRESLGFNDAVFGLGASMFFAAYLLFEIPSNLLMVRVGFRLTLLRIMGLWGIASAATIFVQTPVQFYIVRFLVGVFEAGFTPAVLFYLTRWYPAERRARANALFFMGFVAAPIAAGPLAGLVMTHMHNFLHLSGWQWLFVVEGLAAVVLGVIAWRWLDEGPASATWLSRSQRERICLLLEDTTGAVAPTIGGHWTTVARQPKVWGLGFVAFLVIMGIYALAFWQPTLLKTAGLSLMQVGLASSVSAIGGVLGSLWLGARSDRHHERRGHFVAGALAGAAGLALTALFEYQPVAAIASLSLAAAGTGAAFTILWASPSEVISKDQLAVGFALINTCVACGGLVAPILVATSRTVTGSFSASLFILAGVLVLAAVAFLVVLRPQTSSGE